MIKLLNLIQNENMKIYRRLRTWILILLLVMFVVIVAIFSHSGKEDQLANWKEMTQGSMDQAAKEMTNPELSPTFKEQLKQEMKLKQYALDHDIPPVEMTMWGGVQNAANLIQFVTLFTVIIAGDMVAGEFTWGTIKLLLIRPASRSKILLSKYMATLLFAALLLVILFISAVFISGLIYGFSYFNMPYTALGEGGAIQVSSMPLHMMADYSLKLVELVMVVTLAFMISTVFRSSSLAIGISIFIMFAGQVISMLLLRYSWGKYFLFANTDLTPYLDGKPLADGMSLGFSISVLLFYFLLFNVLSWEIFRRRDIAA
ncbi:ABC transporter permease [Paenibacillus hexagrammi]|uniref:ABC transporter permease n=1 Tax=Paenibacillus hexagrammi TaxID=2908839 RepID=A0ABY3SLZ5_9BACL|nr:ABC transporter permease [Paenibacillus sp. YPD9-1]UJF34239.1 ABC transporter permease [Paenibacillus sp. YPD9-1]